MARLYAELKRNGHGGWIAHRVHANREEFDRNAAFHPQIKQIDVTGMKITEGDTIDPETMTVNPGIDGPSAKSARAKKTGAKKTAPKKKAPKAKAKTKTKAKAKTASKAKPKTKAKAKAKIASRAKATAKTKAKTKTAKAKPRVSPKK